ncbi:hypothetical protein BV25DRAFT_1788048, partial [Artomyces pyxidatus]
VDAAVQSLVSLRRRRNALTHTCRLPFEIHAFIFQCLASECPPGLSHRPSGREQISMLGWITVTHVCWSWRQVALDALELWQKITFSIGPAWTDMMIARVHQRPISV